MSAQIGHEAGDSTTDVVRRRTRPGSTEGDAAPAGDSRSMSVQVLVTLGKWTAFVLALWVATLPIMSTTMRHDDFGIPFGQFLNYGGGLGSTFDIASDTSAGHFNYLGQFIGAVVGWTWIQWAFRFSLPLWWLYSAMKLGALVFLLASGARVLRLSVESLGGSVRQWTARLLVASLACAVLQVHVWTYDPVSSYPWSSFVGTALGLLAVGEGIRLASEPSARRALWVGVSLVVAVFYYEINGAAVVAVLVLVVVMVMGDDPELSRVRRAVLGLAPVAATLVLAFVARSISLAGVPPEGAYGGTAVDLGEAAPTFGRLVVTVLPASFWRLSREQTQGITVGLSAVATVYLLALAMILLYRRHPLPRLAPPRSWTRALGLGLSIASFGIVAIGIQAVTPKVQIESTDRGFIYLYYTAATLAAVVIVAGVILYAFPRLPVEVRTALSGLLIAFFAAQYVINENLQDWESTNAVPANQAVLEAYAHHAPEAERCEALHAIYEGWGSWDYYRVWVIDGANEAYQTYVGEPFCSNFASPEAD